MSRRALLPRLPEQLRNLFGGRLSGRPLPATVAAAIEAHKYRGEILVRVIQLGLVAVLAALYTAAPKTNPAAWALAPYVMAAYAAASLGVLVLAWREQLPDWLIYCSIVLDVALLYLLIWSYHLQYMQPAPFVLKSPTLLHVFVLISVRALRFEPRFVAAAGAAAAAGWALMTAYVAGADPGGASLTHDYATYITSNTLLVGAEVDKIIAILMVTGILTLVLALAQQLLTQAALEGAAAQKLSRFFDDSVAEEIRSGDGELAPGEGVSREAAILNVDIRGFSKLVDRLPPTQALRLLTAYQHAVVPVIQTHGGVIDKFIGDGIMATFGAARPSDRYAADALRAMEQIVATARDWGDDPLLGRLETGGIGVAVTAGTVVFGTVGEDERLEVTVVGAAVNLSAKLESMNKALGCVAVTTAEAFELAVRQGYRPPTPPELLRTSIKGLSGEHELRVWRRADARL